MSPTVTYLDSSAIVKLVIAEPESAELRDYLVRRKPLVSSALASTEVARALLDLGSAAVERGQDVLSRIELLSVSEQVLAAAGRLRPPELRSLAAIHLASAAAFGTALRELVTYDQRMACAGAQAGWVIASPGSPDASSPTPGSR